MKICVIGGTGNISRRIVDELINNNHDVYCFNRGLSGDVPNGAQHIIGDRNDYKFFEKRIQDESFDYAIDMVCMDSKQALSSIRAFNGVKHLIFCSSTIVYDNNYTAYPKNENYRVKPKSKYALGKADAEKIFLDNYNKNTFPVTILRLSMTYGPQLGLYRQISSDPSWIARIKKGKPIIICDNGSARCQFMHINDAANIFVSLLGRKECFGEIYNVVGKNVYTWKDYHIEAMKIIGKEVQLVEVPFKYLKNLKIPRFQICRDITSYDMYFSPDKLLKVLPEFNYKISLKRGMFEVIKSMENGSLINNSFSQNWEERIIKKKVKGKLNKGLLINALLFKLDKIILIFLRKFYKISKFLLSTNNIYK